MRKYFYIFGPLALLALSWAGSASASLPGPQLDTSATSSLNSIGHEQYQLLGTGWTGSTSYFEWKDQLQSGGNLRFTLCINYTSQYEGGSLNSPCFDATGFQFNYNSGAGGGPQISSTTIATTTFNPAYYYAIKIEPGGGPNFNSNTFLYGSNTTSTFNSGELIDRDLNTQATSTIGAARNMYFTFTQGPPPPAVSFLHPLDTATTTDGLNFTPSGDFWDMTISNTSTSLNYWIKVNYSHLSTSTPDFTDAGLVFLDGEHLLAKSQPLIYPPLSDGTTWYAWATLSTESASSTVIASTTPISFQVYYPAPGLGGVSATTTIASTTITCSSGNWFSDGMCGAISFLFYPSQSSIDSFINLKAVFQNKPPFGYFTSFETAMTNLNNGTSSIILMDASGTTAFSAILTPFRTGIGWLIGFLFAWWAIHRFRHIEL